jgi:hypothetical protein
MAILFLPPGFLAFLAATASTVFEAISDKPDALL